MTTARLRIIPYLQARWFALGVATLAAICLGAVASALASLVGPAILLLQADPGQALPFSELVGERLAPWFAQWFGASTMTPAELMAVVPVTVVVLVAIKATLFLAHWFLWERAGEQVAMALRGDLFRQYLRVHPERRGEQATTAAEETLVAAITNDIKQVREYIIRFYGGLPRELLQVAFLTITLYLLSPRLLGIFALGLLPALVVGAQIGRKLRKRSAKVLDDYSDLSEWLQQRLLGFETIKHYGMGRAESEAMATRTWQLYKTFYKRARVQARTSPALEWIAVVAMVVVLLVALNEIRTGETSGSVQLSFFATLAFLSQSIGKAGKYLNANRRGAAAVERLDDLNKQLDEFIEPLALPQKLSQRADLAAIDLNQVSVSYTNDLPLALSDFNFRFEGGRVYAITGPSGAGKSTLMQIILGLRAPTKGNVQWQHPEHLDPMMRYLPQRLRLMSGTITENVIYPATEAHTEDVNQALRRAMAWDFVQALPHGSDTVVGSEGGHGLSGGQLQRVMLARLCYRPAAFVLADEGTSALDPESEQEVIRMLRLLAEAGAVVITIAHRQTVAAQADVVLHLEHGRLVVDGPPKVVFAEIERQRAQPSAADDSARL